MKKKILSNTGSHRVNTLKARTGALKADTRVHIELLLLSLPAVIYVFIFSYLPMPGIIIAFKKFFFNLGIFGSPWVGFNNFKFLFMTGSAWKITSNTIVMNVIFIVTTLVLSVAIALMLFEITKRHLVKVYQTIMIFPHFLSWVVVSYMFYGIMNSQYGLMNNFLEAIGKEPVDWYSNADLWLPILIVSHLWKSAGMGSVIYFATLMGIDSEYYEAAVIDGATKWQMTKYISLPFLYPMITMLTILSVGGIIRGDFGMIYNLTRDVPMLYRTTDVIDTYVFRALRTVGDAGMAASAGLYQSVVGFIMILATNWIVRKISPDNSLF
jgi:putative aldouronate transport system permease protein